MSPSKPRRDPSSIPTGRLRRSVTPGVAFLRAGAADALARVATRKLIGTERDEVLDARLAEAAERTAAMLGQMKGALMKIGQLVSFVDLDLVPPAYRRALEMLQADAPPMAPDVVRDVIRAELGADPSAIFSWWSPLPMAAASIGQVHLARLGTGDDEAELAVKVQYPGVADAINADLANTALLSMVGTMMQRVIGDLGGKVDMRAVVAEVKDRITEELDYRVELTHQQEFADLYRDHPSIGVPEVVPELSTERVLTMQYVDAMRWPAAVAASKELRDAWGRTIALFVFGSLYNHHLFNADPHPGNYLFHEDGRVTFLDFGCVKHFAPEFVARMKAMLNAARRDDPDEMLDAFVGTGMLQSREGVDVETAVTYIRRAYEPVVVRQPYTYTREWAAAQMADVVQLRLDAGRRSFLRQADLPSDSVFLLRITAGLSSVLAGLEATIDWDELGDQLGLYDDGTPVPPVPPEGPTTPASP